MTPLNPSYPTPIYYHQRIGLEDCGRMMEIARMSAPLSHLPQEPAARRRERKETQA
jgi:hypothetical protein